MRAYEIFLNYAKKVKYQDIPLEVVDVAKLCILNTLAAIIGGSNAPGVKEIARLVRKVGGKKESTVFFHNYKAPAHDAVMVNASMPRSFEFDDVHLKTGIHPFSIIVPVAMAAAEYCGGITGKKLITAIILGVEALCRMRLVPDFCVGLSGWSGEVYGAFGGAFTAGKILDLEDKLIDALGLAYINSSGSAQALFESSLAYRLQQGFSARAGLFSSILASIGITGPKESFDGRAGFYPVYYRGINYDLSRLIENLGESYETLNVITKQYPCCGFLMAAIENLITLKKQNRIENDNISKIIIRVNKQMYNVVALPLEVKYRPQKVSDALYSLPYVLGTAALKNDVFLDDFSSVALKETKRLKMIDKIEVVIDKKIEVESKKLNAILSLNMIEIKTRNKKQYSRKAYHSKGFPQNRMSLQDCRRKILRSAPFAASKISKEKVDRLCDLVSKLERLKSTKSLSILLF